MPLADDDLVAGLQRYQSAQQPFGSGLVALGREEGPISAPSSSRASSARQRSCTRDINDVLHAHNSRSENLRSVLVGSRRAS